MQSTQTNQEYFVCLNQKCTLKDKFTMDKQQIEQHQKKQCILEEFNAVRNKVIDRESKISKVTESCSLDIYNQRINDWYHRMFEEFRTFLVKEVDKISVEFALFYQSFQDSESIYKAVESRDYKLLNIKQDSIVKLLYLPQEHQEFTVKLEQKFSKLELLKNQLGQNIEQFIEQDQPKFYKKMNEIQQNLQGDKKPSSKLAIDYCDALLKLNKKDYDRVESLKISLKDIKKSLPVIKQITGFDLIIQENFYQIQDISPIRDLKKLNTLISLNIDLANNKIPDISPIREIKALTTLKTLKLNFMGNQIRDISPIKELKVLKALTHLKMDFYRNIIQDINPISELRTLQALINLNINLNGNKIEDIKPIGELRVLSALISLKIDLGWNQFFDFSPLRGLQALSGLKNLEINLNDTTFNLQNWHQL